MRITNETPKLPKKAPEPRLKWQREDFSRCQEFRFHLPYPFLLLCKLWNKTPDDLLHDFMHSLSSGASHIQVSVKAKSFLHQYAIEIGYGQPRYNKEDIENMFSELENILSLWPDSAKMKIIEMHARWRDEYYNWWFKKWRKRRKLL